MPEGKAQGCTETKADNGSKSTADAGTIQDSKAAAEKTAAADKADAATPQKPVKSRFARSHPRRSWFGRADLLTLLAPVKVLMVAR